MKREFSIDGVSRLKDVAKSLLELINSEGYNIIEFYGSMGVGKTTLIREICSQLGVVDIVTSPTFAIINEYKIDGSDKMCYHFDFYRINKLEEVLDMGYEEYFYSGNLCLIEWPELVEELLPMEPEGDIKPLRVLLEQQTDGTRDIKF